MDTAWLLKKNVGVKTVIYDVKCNLTFLLLRYCQGAMVIRQQIQFSLSCLRHSSISVYYQAMSNRQLHLLCFMYSCKIQLCRICRWLKTSCSRANKSDSGQRYVHWFTYVGVVLMCLSMTLNLVTKLLGLTPCCYALWHCIRCSNLLKYFFI